MSGSPTVALRKQDSPTKRDVTRSEIKRIANFVLLGRIGEGGMGEVYAGYDTHLDRKVAIKLVRRRKKGRRADYRMDERLLREAQTLARLSHPNVVQVYAAGIHEAQVYIAMEFVRGDTLTDWLETLDDLPRRARQRAILKTFMEAGRGLEAAHEAGLVHRDFKPDNVLVGDDGRVRVLDFGLARMFEEQRADTVNEEESAGRVGDGDDAQRDATTPPPEAPFGDMPFAPAGETMRMKGPETIDSFLQRAERAFVDTLRASDERDERDESDERDERDERDSGAGSSSSARRKRHKKYQVRSGLTESGTIVGTPRYMAPEQMRAEPADARSDQFSYCVALYEALGKQHPFDGKDFDEIEQLVHEGTVSPPKLDIQTQVRKALERGFSLDPEDRFSDMRSLLQVLDPRKRRQRRQSLLLGGIMSAILLTSLLLVLLGRTEPAEAVDPCAGVSRTMDEIWTDQRRQKIGAIFKHSDLPAASATWENAEARLGEYVNRWKDFRHQRCRATLVDRTQSENAYDYQMICLNRGRYTLQALLESIEDPSADPTHLVSKIGEATSSLPDVDECKVEYLNRELALPAGRDAQAVARLRQGLVKVDTVGRLGRIDDALRDVERRVEEASQLDYPPVHGEALYYAAKIYALRSTPESVARARQLLTQAMSIAVEHDHNELEFLTWAEAGEIALDREDGTSTASAWIPLAEAAATRSGNPPDMRAHVDALFGRMYRREKKFDKAIEHLKAAVALKRDREAAQWQLIDYLKSLANCLSEMGRREESYEYFQEALRIATDLFGDKSPNLAQLQSDLGAYFIRTQEWDKAQASLVEALETYLAVYGDVAHVNIGKVYDNLANVETRRGHLDVAYQHATKQKEIYDRTLPENHSDHARPLTNLGNITQLRQEFDASIAHHEAALDIVASTPNADTLKLALMQANLADVLLQAGKYERADTLLTATKDTLRQYPGEIPGEMATFIEDMADQIYFHLVQSKGGSASTTHRP